MDKILLLSIFTIRLILQTMRQTCPEPCTCTMTHVVSDAAGAVIPLITVDCSNKDLEMPPPTLPPGATTLRLEGNKVKWYEHFWCYMLAFCMGLCMTWPIHHFKLREHTWLWCMMSFHSYNLAFRVSGSLNAVQEITMCVHFVIIYY